MSGLPLSTPGACCAHNLNFHITGDPGRPCTVCQCAGFRPKEEEGRHQCKAEYHGPAGHFRCTIMVTEETIHKESHQAPDSRIGTFYWSDAVAVYPHPDRPLPPLGSARDRQVGGDHYSKHKIQHWDIAVEYGLNYFEGAIVKYVLRHRDKNGVEDLKKARHTLDKLIEIEEGKEG